MNLLIGIQARSTSKRLPNKVNFMLDDTTILNQVLNHVKSCVMFLNEKRKADIRASFCLLIPEGDPIKDLYKNIKIIEGPEDDVLSRYMIAMDMFHPDYLVRITGDCPLLPAPLITRNAMIAIEKGYDYVSNVDEKIRTFIDGLDVEVISKKLMYWLNEKARGKEEREHVTLLFRKMYPKEFKVCHLIGFLDLSFLKLSVDTEDDYKLVKNNIDCINKKLEIVKEWGHDYVRY